MEATPSRPGPIFWAMLGLAVALTIQAAQANSLGGWSGLLAVGEESYLRPLLTEQLGDLALVESGGHDGQVAYVIGLDPWAKWGHEVLPSPAYRYRRILLPALAGAFGLIDGRLLLWTLTMVNAAAFALAAGTAALIADTRSMHRWAPLAVLLNVGLWLSLHVTSVDVLAFALALSGLAARLKGRDVMSITLFALAVLAKEMYALVPIAVAGHLWINDREPRRALRYMTSLIPLALWNAFLVTRLAHPFETGGNLTWPFFGILEGSRLWADNDPRDLALLALTGGALILAVVQTWKSRRSVWAWIGLAWLLLAALSGHWVWDFGNNAARAFLPLASFALLGLMDRTPDTDRATVLRALTT